MMDNDLGMTARGMCLEPLLHHGIPGNQTIETMIQEIDGQLSENQSRLEECMLELMELGQNLSGVAEKFIHPSEAMSHITENRLLDKQMCFDPDSDAIARLLREVIQLMDRNPGCEEKIMNQLFESSCAEGVALPYRTTASNSVNQSVVSINTAVDSAEHVTDNLWNEITGRMKQFYCEQLRALPYGEHSRKLGRCEEQTVQCVQGLSSLIAPGEAWSLYRSLRMQQLDKCIKKANIVNLQKSKKSQSLAVTVEQFSELVRCVISMTNSDFELLTSTAFSGTISPITGLTEIYTESLLREITCFCEVLCEDFENVPSVKSPKREKKKIPKADKEISKSPSDVGFLGHFKVGNIKPQSKSADNLLEHGEQEFSDIQVLPPDVLEAVTQLVKELLELECHMDRLHSSGVWQTSVTNNHKAKPASNIKGVLKPSSANKSDENNGDVKKLAFSPRSFEKSGLLPSAIPPPFGATQAMIAQVSSSLKVAEKPFEEQMSFVWRPCFARLAPDLARSIQHHIHSQSAGSLHSMEQHLSQHTQIESVRVSSELIGGRLDYPVLVAKDIDLLLREINKMLPLAMAGPEGPFTLTRAAFIDSTSISLKNIIIKLSSLCTDDHSRLPLKCQYIILASMAYLRNHILSYENALEAEDNGKGVFPTLYRQYCQAVDELSRLIIETHNSSLMSWLLHDAESHFWDDSKDFFEGERCSFSIQMWYSHLMALKNDLWVTCPPKLSQTMFTAVLQESLSVLTQRYLRVKPSYRRTLQFRGDITAILLCTSELLFYATSSMAKYIDPTNANSEHFNIHVNCAMLLAAMVIVTAPIDCVYKIYKKGFKKKHSVCDDDTGQGYVSHWLSWLRPQVFPFSKTTPDSLQTTSALYLQLRLLTTKPDVNWTLLLQSLLMKEYALPIMLLSKIAVQHTERGSVESSPEHNAIHANHHNTITTTNLTTQTAKQNFSENGNVTESCIRQIFNAFIRIFLQCSEFPASLTQVLIPVFERSDSWDVFDINYPPVSITNQMPPWLSAVVDCLEPFVLRVINPGIKVIITRCKEPVGTEPISLRLKELPCGCPATKEPPIGNKANRDVLAEALYSTITQLVSDLHTLPTPILMFFKATQYHAAQKGIRSPQNSAGIKVLAIALKCLLCDIERIENLVDDALDSSIVDYLRLLSECLYHVLTAPSYGKGSGTPRLAGAFMKANRNWISDQMDFILEHLDNKLFDLPSGHPLDGTTIEFTENLLISQASSILSLDSGAENLQKAYNVILNNKVWIMSQLDIAPLLGPHTAPVPCPISLSLDPPNPELYNPLKAYKTLGDVLFNQAAVMSFRWDWAALLSSDLGLSQPGFRSLLFNRHEMQDGAYLEENEKKPVESLRRKYRADSQEL